MFRFKYRYCKARMTAFVHGELSPQSRRRVARYIDECADCYAEYMRHRELQRELLHDLPAFGKPDEAQLDRMWSVIQGEVFTPQRRTTPNFYRMRYGFATAAFFVVFMLPFTLGNNTIATASTTPPTPAEVVTAAMSTPGGTVALAEEAQILVSASVETTDTDEDVTREIEPAAVPQKTPEAGQ